jgi:hypothetical protein
MMMQITPLVAPPTCNKTTPAPKSGHIFRPVAQTSIGTLEPVDLHKDDLTSFFYPMLSVSQAPLTTSFDANLNTVILTGEDAYKAMVADKIETQADAAPSGFSKSTANALMQTAFNEATNYSKNAKLLDLTPVVDEPVAFMTEELAFRPAPEKAKAMARQAELLKLQDEKLKGLRQQNVLMETSSTSEPISAKAVLSMSEAKTLVAEEQKSLPPVKDLLPKVEADYWKSLLLASKPTVTELPTLSSVSPLQTLCFSMEAF